MPNEYADAPGRAPVEDRTRDSMRDIAVENQSSLSYFKQSVLDTATAALPPLRIIFGDSSNHLNPVNPRSAEIARDASNADRQMRDLMEKSGATRQGRDGLTQEDLVRLEKDRTLTADQRAAVKYLRENYETLQTGRSWDTSGPGAAVTWLTGSSRITAKSLGRHADTSRPTGGEVPPPEDPAGRVPNRAARPTDQADPRDRQTPRSRTDVQAAPDFGDTKVQAWKGPWSVAEKMLKGQNLDAKAQMDLTRVLKNDAGVDWNKAVKEGTELITEQNLERVRKAIEETRNPKLVEWFNKRYPKR